MHIIKSRVPGQYQNIFVQQQRQPGSAGQIILLDKPLTRTGNKRVTDIFKWPISILGTPRFEYRTGDGNNFRLNGVITAFNNTNGSITESQRTPHTRIDGIEQISSYFPLNTYRRYTTTPVDPASGQATVILLLSRGVLDGNYQVLLSSRTALTGVAAGWCLRLTATGEIGFSSGDGVIQGTSSGTLPLIGWTLFGVLHIPNTMQYIYRNGILADSDSCVGQGIIASTEGIALNSRHGVTPNARGQYIVRALVWYPETAKATTICTETWFREVSNAIFGAHNILNNSATYTQSGSATKQVSTRWHTFSPGSPRSGYSNGLLLEPNRINNCYNNINPQVTTGVVADGGTLTVVDDSTRLLADGIEDFGSYVFRLVTAGTSQSARFGAATGSTNKHSCQIWARGNTGGETLNIGWWDVSSGTFTSFDTETLTTNWQRVTFNNITPNDTDSIFAIQSIANQTIYFVMQDNQEGTYCTSPITNTSTTLTKTRGQGVLTTTFTPDNNQGSIEITITPQTWSGSEAGDQTILTRETGSPALLRVLSGTWQSSLDGTTTLNSGIAPADGVQAKIRLRWHGTQMSIDVNGTTVSGIYDGSIAGSGKLQIQGAASVLVKNIIAYRSGSN